jgi:hypothetical protein
MIFNREAASERLFFWSKLSFIRRWRLQDRSCIMMVVSGHGFEKQV